MRAAGALPTEPRVQKMNDVQWLWYYMNLQKDLEEDRDKAENYLDYLGSWINPELAKSVMATKAQKKSQGTTQGNNAPNAPKAGTVVQVSEDTEIEYGDTAVSDSFEEEYRRALAGEGITNEEFTELPDSQNAGNPFESQEDFIARVMSMQGLTQDQIIYHNDDDGADADMVASIDPLKPGIQFGNGEPVSLDSIIPNVSNPDDLDFFDDEEE